MGIRVQEGDLFDSGLPALAHGCNAQGVMGAGIAAQFRSRYPEMYREYRKWCHETLPSLGDVFVWTGDDVTIFNLITQVDPGPEARSEAVAMAVANMLDYAEAAGIPEIGLPWIGCGIGGLKISVVRNILMILSLTTDVELVVCEL
jgi:O-acetyl-ADP-ribose deacetylase (regulator of RNase III)